MWTLLLFGCPGPSDSASDSPSPDSALSCEVEAPDAGVLDIEGVAACGQPIFEAYCGGCHGDDGRGTTGAESGPDLSGHVPAHTDEELAYVLLAGQGDMPASGLSNDRNAHVLAWLRATFGDYDGQGH